MTQLQSFDTTHYPAYTTKVAAVQALRQAAAEDGDIDNFLRRLWLSDTTGWADGATVTEAGYLAIEDLGDEATH